MNEEKRLELSLIGDHLASPDPLRWSAWADRCEERGDAEQAALWRCRALLFPALSRCLLEAARRPLPSPGDTVDMPSLCEVRWSGEDLLVLAVRTRDSVRASVGPAGFARVFSLEHHIGDRYKQEHHGRSLNRFCLGLIDRLRAQVEGRAAGGRAAGAASATAPAPAPDH